MLTKENVDLFYRLRQILVGLDWLTTIYIPSHETMKWSIVRISFRERLDCFIACIDTAIRGYVYRFDDK